MNTFINLVAYALILTGEFAPLGYALLIANAVYGSAEARRKQRQQRARERADYNASLVDRSVTTIRADPPLRTVYGRAITGGEIVAIFTSDKSGERTDGTAYTRPDGYKHLVIAIAAHECQAINEVYIDGVAVGSLDADGNSTGGEFFSTQTEVREVVIAASGTATFPAPVTVLTVWDNTLSTFPSGNQDANLVAGTHSLSVGNTVVTNTGANPATVTVTYARPLPSVRIHKHLGSPTQTADAFLTGLVPAEWTSADRLLGITYCVATIDLENQRFQGGPPNFTFDITGKAIYDPRSGLTAYSENPALCIRDYLTGEHGFNCVASDIDDAACIVAANACDETINLDVGGVVTSGPRYTCNGVTTTDQARETVLQDLAESMAGTVSYGARWKIMAGVYTAPVMALTDDDLHGQIAITQGGAGMDATFNTVRGQYVPAGGSVPADFDVYANATFVVADGQSLYEDVTLPFTDNKARCRNLARIFVERNRDGLVAQYPAKMRAWPLEVGDRVTVTSAEYGWSSKVFRITDWQFGISSAVLLTLQEDAAAIYDLADAATSDPSANSALPSPWVVATPSGVTASSGTSVAALADGTTNSRVRVAWAAITDPYMADGSGRVLIRWRRQLYDAVNVWQSVPPIPASEIYGFIDSTQAGNAITIEVRFRNGLGALSSPYYLSHTVSANSTEIRTQQMAASAATDVFTASDTTIGPSGSGTSITVTLDPGWRVLVSAQAIHVMVESGGTAGFFRGEYQIIENAYGTGGSIWDSRFFRFDVVANSDQRISAVMSYEEQNTGGSAVSRTFRWAIDGTSGGAGNKGSGTLDDARLKVELIKR